MAQIAGTIQGALVLTAQTITPSDGSVTNASVANNAAIASTKLQQRRKAFYAKPSATAAAAETIPIARIYGATASLVALRVGSVVACVGDSTVTIDLKKNGTSVLSATVQLDSANTARVTEAATINTTGAVVDDLFELVVTVSAGTGTLATGIFAELVYDEDPA
jgi:hypothetical protein